MKRILLLLLLGICTYTNAQPSGYLKRPFIEIIFENQEFGNSNTFNKSIDNDTITYSIIKRGVSSQFFYVVNDTVIEYVVNIHDKDRIIIYSEELPNKIIIKELLLDKNKPYNDECATYIDKGMDVYYYNEYYKEPNPYRLTSYYVADNIINLSSILKDTIQYGVNINTDYLVYNNTKSKLIALKNNKTKSSVKELRGYSNKKRKFKKKTLKQFILTYEQQVQRN